MGNFHLRHGIFQYYSYACSKDIFGGRTLFHLSPLNTQQHSQSTTNPQSTQPQRSLQLELASISPASLPRPQYRDNGQLLDSARIKEGRRKTIKPPMTMKLISFAAVLLLPCLLKTSAAFSHIHPKTPTKTQLSIVLPVEVEDDISERTGGTNDSRRAFLATAALAFTFATPAVSHATYGEDAKILLPDIVQDMADRNTKQCLVESLGTRQCLVYLDPDNQLYKGHDTELLFERLGKSIAALKDVPIYIESKEWNKVIGVLTGPMGTLSSTMCELAKMFDDGNNDQKAKKLSVDVRKDLYAISGASDRKNGKEALAAFQKAEEKLDNFVTLVSSSKQ